MTDPVLADLAVRVARAEMERDAALEREQKAKEAETRAWRAYGAIWDGDKEKILDAVHIIGIPARDFADIYMIEQEWRAAGGCQEWLDGWRVRQEMTA